MTRQDAFTWIAYPRATHAAGKTAARAMAALRRPFVMGFATGLVIFGAALHTRAPLQVPEATQIYDSVPLELQRQARGVREA